MNSKLKVLTRNLTYSVNAKVLSTLISIFLILIVPKVLGVTEYSYWQLYVFYLNYIGILGFGWSDGIYLKIGGAKYIELDRAVLISQFWLMAITETILSLAFLGIIFSFIADPDKRYILIITAISGFFLIMRSLFFYILEATNRIKEFALFNIIDRVLYLLLTVVALVLHVVSYKPLIIIDMVSKIVSFLMLAYLCKDIVIGKAISCSQGIREAWDNISIGIKLMIANIASTLIIGVVRWGIERQWDIATFGKVSLTLSISNLLLLLVNSVGVVMFPLLRQAKQEKLPRLYLHLRNGMMFPLFGLLVLYYPGVLLLSQWLPKYSESLKYMAIILPICIYESKISMLINTYLKNYRKEKTILFVNGITLGLSVLTTYVSIFVVSNLLLAVLSIFILLAFRCILAEIILAKFIKIQVFKDTVYELVVSICFILFNWYFAGYVGFILYLGIYFVYLLIKRKELSNLLILINTRLRSSNTE
ncbi:hypothetical protein R70723_26155 [Paenibacillus sp. FSL R7-0273]|uniref:hypothetical protein n=1 Tax=Paenibacillus sp. FSL R7-0273 TaxID=1536772 RepID=UPI0004F6BC64|nr:hypothetical protein [Paenibacillus sp. FSL R7-0273]AIQ48999.1 hypothetical protein R70723_26155 [Paenibacillus sp. FSL R7-0273]OMF90554.1 hypothetical protein BK144_17220 [Paenibacillus sp. FSL R7-0273]